MKVRTAAAALILATAAARAGAQEPASATQSIPPYLRYPTPAACVAAVERVDKAVTWGEELDSLAYDPARALPPAAAEIARRCIGQFMPASGGDSISAKQVEAMFVLALSAGNDSLATKMLHRTMTAQRSARDSIEILVPVLTAYLRGRPVRLSSARATAALLDSLGYVHPEPPGRWSNHHGDVLTVAQAMLDSTAMAGEAQALLAAVRALPKRERTLPSVQRLVMSALSGDVLWTLHGHGADSAFALLKNQVTALLGPEAFAASWFRSGLELLGKPAPPLQPDFWFNREPGDSILPRAGRVTLIQYVDAGCLFCDYAVLRRLKARFGDSLELILLAHTRGRLGPHMPLEPAREAELIRDFFRDTHRLNAKLAVWTTPFISRPDPDRRRVPQDIPAYELYRSQGGLLIDRRGIVLPILAYPSSPEGETFLVSMIEALLKH
ncbi:MAG: hypothetical protein NUW01_06215 [Gemmatimonadaceae bacterium]|nr:hypothetical protein [Gemmatimonadaceae bacterium]